MATPWEVDTAEYAEISKYVGDEDIYPNGIAFSPNGTKMYIVGGEYDTVFQYTLSTPWDVSTATYAEKSKYVGDEDTYHRGIAFSSNGTKMYIVGDSNDTVYQYTLSTGWDVSTATYATKLKDVSTQDTSPRGIAFSPNGTKMYIVGGQHDTVYQYTLGTPWDVSTADYATYKSISAQDIYPAGVAFSPNGTKMYMVGYNTDTVYQYTLSTSWDVSSATYADKSKDVSAQDTSPYGVAFSSNGTKMYIVGGQHDTVYQYTLLVPPVEQAVSGALTFTGVTVKRTSSVLSGVITFVGSLTTLVRRLFRQAELSIESNKSDLSIESNKSELSIEKNKSDLSIEE